MGEAKVRREAMRRMMLAECEKWSFPPTPEEADIVAQISTLPRVNVRRVDNDAIAYMRMPGKECHANTRWYQDNDPEGKAMQATGWWEQNGSYVLHSVVRRDGAYFCITPQQPDVPDTFEFVPDPVLEWREEGEYRVCYRSGYKCSPGVRADPDAVIKYMATVRERLESGMLPLEAAKVAYEPSPY